MVHCSASSWIKTVAMLVAIVTRSLPKGGVAAASFVGTSSRGSLMKSFLPSSRQHPQLSSTVRFESGSKRRRTREANRKAQAEIPQTLDWETFEFSSSPKWDKRFDENTSGGGQFVTDDELEDWREEEAKEDREAARQLDEHHQALQSLDPALVERASEVLVRHINEDRIERVESVLKQRTKQSRFLFENPTNPSNVWACLRTIDSFGIQNVDVVVDGDRYRGKAAIAQKRGMRTAMGSAQWLTLINHPDTASAVASVRQQGFKIYASDLNPNSKDVRELDWVNAGPICIVMGNENNGISDEMRELADETFTLPMSGFAESFNLSVATAITLAHMSAKSGTSPDGKTKFGPLQPGKIDPHEYNCLRLKGLLNSLPQKRMGRALLRNAGIDLPNAIDLL